MKVKNDPRHLERIRVMRALFTKSFTQNSKVDENSTEWEIQKKLKPIDRQIEQNAPAWPIEQLSPVDLAILRLAVWELLYKEEKEPYKVVVDEAVEIAKEYGTDTSPNFINGVLGSIIKSKLNN